MSIGILLMIWIFGAVIATRTQTQGKTNDARQFSIGRELLQDNQDECQREGGTGGFYQELSGGVAAPFGRYPYMMAIQVKNGAQFNHHCGGTLIAPNLILTAAHCIYIQGKYDLRLGSSLTGKLSGKPVQIYAARAAACRHQPGEEGRILINAYHLTSDYQGNLLRGGDIAILQTQKPFDYTGPFINYASSDQVNFDNSRLFSALGYGATDVQDLNSRASQVLQLQLGFFAYEDDTVCQEKLFLQNSRYELNKQSNICFGYKGVDTCSGDSGGPMLLADDNYGITPIGNPGADIQVGITSWGPVTDCTPGNQNNPGVYTKVSNYIQWISSVVQAVGTAAPTLVQPSQPSPTPSPPTNSFICSDIKPAGVFTCEQQLLFGKCDASWMVRGGYCLQTCGRCLLAIDDPSTNGQDCSDIQPPGKYSCNEQRQFQKCNEDWMRRQNYCQKSCGRCGNKQQGFEVARSTLQCFGEPQANFKGEIIKLGTTNFKSSVEECCTSCDKNPRCNVYVYCPRLQGCRNLNEILQFGRCDLKFQQAVADRKEPQVWYRGNQTDFTSGYIFAKNIYR